MKKVIATGVSLALLLSTGASFVSPREAIAKTAVQATVKQAGDTFTENQKLALAEVNRVRKASGLMEAQLNPFLIKAAENHANYIKLNGNTLGHSEKKGKKGFTGNLPVDRLLSIGADEMTREYATEIINFSTTSTKTAISELLDSSYHRASILQQYNTQMGVAQVGMTTVITFSTDDATMNKVLDHDTVYPYNGQKNVNIGFYGFEDPNPLEQFKIKLSGSIISASLGLLNRDVTLTVKDSSGASIPMYGDSDNGFYHFYPKYELAYGETYTATLSYTPYLVVAPSRKKTWSFTTVAKPKSSLSKDESHLKINGKYVPVKVTRTLEQMSYNYSPLLKNKITYVNAKQTFERLNATVTVKSKVHTFKTKTKTVTYTEGAKVATVNGKSVILTQLPYKSGSTLQVPLSFLTKTIGAKTSIDTKNRTVSITSKLDTPYNYQTLYKDSDWY